MESSEAKLDIAAIEIPSASMDADKGDTDAPISKVISIDADEEIIQDEDDAGSVPAPVLSPGSDDPDSLN